ncbi:hypothetical protein M404DRAFT_999543 [Pisolithus tinctorius Marx 270]|uniref:Uncharacterized protein n=1 Tax=Pisolithus tinctorius Marx 270 TaxID=870435 RepID=A0A0C3PDF5_PISTI|nr:hypothetical protein M404DRAFT_999543 [Pisolithus tinctorius Marx 270]
MISPASYFMFHIVPHLDGIIHAIPYTRRRGTLPLWHFASPVFTPSSLLRHLSYSSSFIPLFPEHVIVCLLSCRHPLRAAWQI